MTPAYTHAAPKPRTPFEAAIAEAIDPEPFARKRRGAELFADRQRRRAAVRAAMRVSDAIDAWRADQVGQEQAEAQAREYGR